MANRLRVRRLRLGAAVVLLLATLGSASGVSAGLSGFPWPVQSLGNRGADVLAVQSLLRGHGIRVDADWIYSANTVAGVRSFQSQRKLPVTGVVDAATWTKLVVPVGPGAKGEAVLTLQRQLNLKHRAGLRVTGTFDAETGAAVRRFEQHVRHPVDGTADTGMWRYLIAHFATPSFSGTGLCDYSVGNGAANWGTGSTIGQLEAAGRRFAGLRKGGVPVGDLGWEHGGDIPGHATHETGLDIDLRPVRDNRDQCRWGTNWRFTSYDRTATRELIKAIRATAPGHVKLIYFNDPVLIREGWTVWYRGHDDHLHVRYCEVGHSLSAYRC